MPSQFFFLGLIFSVLLTSVMDSRQKKPPCPRETQYFGLFFNNQASKVFTCRLFSHKIGFLTSSRRKKTSRNPVLPLPTKRPKYC